MGRGRAKAKQTKVARELKYSSPETDIRRLKRELSGTSAEDSNELVGSDDPGPDNSWEDPDDWRR